ncbi:MAG: DNA-processing protein DprA [Clostridia bacterium]|nr:DNA-processing protein DprA [Clostridia bacterium]
MPLTEREARALLVMTRGIGWATRERALSAAGSALALAGEPKAYEKELTPSGVSAFRASLRDAQRLIDSLQAYTLLIPGDEGYPQRLAATIRPPHLLFVRGAASLDDPLPVAVVGTRDATAYGLKHTRRIARELAQGGACIISGLALGVDAQAHEGALDVHGRTIAVLGGGHEQFYPEQNRPLMERILAQGGSVISEYPPQMQPGRYTFLDRNRIIAGLSLGVLVTEAPARSGALTTANIALDEGREVFALPGSVENPKSVLPHQLIADGARLVTCGQDILSCVVVERQTPGVRPVRIRRAVIKPAVPAVPQPEAEASAPRRMPEGLSPAGQAVYEALCGGEMDFDALCERTGVAADALGSELTMLELDGVIDALPGLRYVLA